MARIIVSLQSLDVVIVHLVVLWVSVGLPQGVLTQQQQCPTSSHALTDFKIKLFIGHWIEVQRIPAPSEEEDCTSIDYYEGSDKTFKITNTAFSRKTREYDSTNGTARFVENPLSAKMIVSFPEPPLPYVHASDSSVSADVAREEEREHIFAAVYNELQTPSARNASDDINEILYWILDTDYENYAVVLLCQNTAQASDSSSSVSIRVLSRGRELSDESQRAVNEVLESVGQSPSLLSSTRQDCPDTHCKRPLLIQNQLDVTKLAGTWWRVSRNDDSSMDFRNLECATIQFSPTKSGVRIHINGLLDRISGKTSEIKQELFWINQSSKRGVFSFSTDDGGYKGELSVLATDYTTFAVISSCTEFGSNMAVKGITYSTSYLGSLNGVEVLSRTPTILNTTSVFSVNAALHSAGINPTKLIDSSLDGCPAGNGYSPITKINFPLIMGCFALLLIIEICPRC